MDFIEYQMVGHRKRSRSPPAEVSFTATAPRQYEEWQATEDKGLLWLTPTTEAVRRCVARPSADGTIAFPIAAFDMDDTLIRPPSGRVFPKEDPSDWMWLHPHVEGHLRYLHANGFLLVLFSNQLGISKNATWNAAKAEVVQRKVIQLSEALQLPLCAFIATREDAWRKPSPDMWIRCKEEVAKVSRTAGCTSFIDCDSSSFYVGDAAGRSMKTLAGRKKDFSCADRQFAHNIRLPFLTPEEFFLKSTDVLLTPGGSGKRDTGQPFKRLSDAVLKATETPAESFSWGNSSPEELLNLPTAYEGLTIKTITPTVSTTIELPMTAPLFAHQGRQEMVFFVGFPGCGKSTFYQRFFAPYGYRHVNRDTLKTKQKCLQAAESYWRGGESVVVDNTNPSNEDRQPYLDIVAASFRNADAATPAVPLPVRLFVFTHSKGLANHFNLQRARMSLAPRIPTVAYDVFRSRLQRPTLPAEVKAMNIESVWEVPPVACFDGLPRSAKALFSLLL